MNNPTDLEAAAERDALAKLVARTYKRCMAERPVRQPWEPIADALLAAGWRPPIQGEVVADARGRARAFLAASADTPSVEIFVRWGHADFEQMLRDAPSLVAALLNELECRP